MSEGPARPLDPDASTAAAYPAARRPDRRRHVDSHGVRIAVSEWGPAEAPLLLLAHGGFDFTGTFDVFAPMLADAGRRVVTWDQRGHGDSEHTALYSWEADVRDLLAVLDSTSREPVPAVGHSKGAGLLTSLIQVAPGRVSRLVNIEGIPSPRAQPEVSEHERTEMTAEGLAGWLDRRRRAASLARKPGTLEELARRRGRMNPRLSIEWLRYLVTVGGRLDADGWRWKLDPSLSFDGFIGPWRPAWALERLRQVEVPMLVILGRIKEEMSWPATPEFFRPFLPSDAGLDVLDDSGHFAHIEHPRRVADMVIEFLS